MKLIRCVDAYLSTTQLMEKECNYATAYALMKLKHDLQPHADFYSKKEMELANEFGKKDSNGILIVEENGTFTFSNPDKAREYATKKGELGKVDVEDFDVKKIKPPASIKPSQIEALQGFIEFEE